ncbi:probable Sentrin-specific protease 7 at N-terminal half [Coccomyxa sp. Obi]|nr:probable Sentrin-specific protease 7 at N-terminal half [Coccomyxa sp. Obi]
MEDQMRPDNLLDALEEQMDAHLSCENTLTEEELEEKFGKWSEKYLDERTKATIDLKKLHLNLPDKGARFDKHLAEFRAEKERRGSSKNWLQKARENQAEAKAKAREQLHPVMATADHTGQEDARPSVSPDLDDATVPARAREREATVTGNERKAHGPMDARGAGGPSPAGLPPLPAHARGRGAAHSGINLVESGRIKRVVGALQSLGRMQVDAAKGVARQRQSVNSGNLFGQYEHRPGGANRLGGLKPEGSQKGLLPLMKSMHGQPLRASGSGADARTCVCCQQRGGVTRVNGLDICQPCHSRQLAAGNGAGARTRAGKAAADRRDPDDDFIWDTRNIQEPAVKGGGLSTGAFYGANSASNSGRPQARGSSAEEDSDRPDSSRRPRLNTRNKRKQAQQDNEPITLDDTDDEAEAGPGPSSLANAAPLRRSERSNLHMGPSQRFQGLKALFPACGGPGAVEITPADLARLEPEEFLNDTIIDFFMRYIWENLGEDVKKRCYFFNSFFWKKLTEKSGSAASLDSGPRGPVAIANHERVKKWTKALDIFEKDFLFVPIHDHLHWSLLIVCNPGADSSDTSKTPCMLHLDSMSGGHAITGLKKALCAFLTLEWDRKVLEGGNSMPAKWVAANPDAPQRNFELLAKKVKLPMQDNHCDCGLFLLTYLDFFTQGLPASFRLTIHSKKGLDSSELLGLSEYPLFLHHKWFYPGNASKLRGHLRWLLLKLFVDQAPEDQRDNLADALAQAHQDILNYQENMSERYHAPAEYLPMGIQRLKEHLQDEERRKQEKQRQLEEKQRKAEEAREAKRLRSQTSSQLSPGSVEARRRRAAEAAERRRLGDGSADQEDIEIVLEGVDAPTDSQESLERHGGFRLHSKELDGPLDTRDGSPDRVCAQDVEWRSTAKKHRRLDWSNEDEEPDIQVSKEVQSIDIEEGNGGSDTPTASAQPKIRTETPKIEARYQAHFRLHKRYGEDDRLLNVVVVPLRPPLKSSTGVGSHFDEKEREFDSESSAYEFMDYCLKVVPSSFARQRVPRPGGDQRSNDYGIAEWPQQAPPATMSSPVVTLLGSPSPPNKGKVSERTRSHTPKQQTSSGAAGDNGAAAANSRGEQAEDHAHAAHDLTADEDEPHGDARGTILAESRPPDDAAPDLIQVAQTAIDAVKRTLGSVESCEQPASAPDASGGIPWMTSHDAVEKSQRSLEAALAREDALARASKIELPDDACPQSSEQPSGRGAPGEEREGTGRSGGVWQRAIGAIRQSISALSHAGAAPLKNGRRKQPSVAHQDGFTSSDEDEPDSKDAADPQPAGANGPAQIDLTSESGMEKQGIGSPTVHQQRGSCQTHSSAEHVVALQPLRVSGLQGPSSGQLPAENGGGVGESADVDLEVAGKKSKSARRRENAKKRRAAAVSPDLFTSRQQQGNAVSSDDDEADFQDCAPSDAAAFDPNLLHDVEADSQSPVAFSMKAAQEEADHRLAMQLQGQDNDGIMSNELSGLQIDEDAGDLDYEPGKDGAKRKRKGKGKGSPKHSPKKSKHARRSPHAAGPASSMQTPPSGHKNIGSYFPVANPLQMDR